MQWERSTFCEDADELGQGKKDALSWFSGDDVFGYYVVAGLPIDLEPWIKWARRRRTICCCLAGTMTMVVLGSLVFLSCLGLGGARKQVRRDSPWWYEYEDESGQRVNHRTDSLTCSEGAEEEKKLKRPPRWQGLDSECARPGVN
jgi:hypothetical protein